MTDVYTPVNSEQYNCVYILYIALYIHMQCLVDNTHVMAIHCDEDLLLEHKYRKWKNDIK